MIQKILHFIKYHNAFSIGVMVIFAGFSLTLAASPEAREFFVSKQEVVYSSDNSYLLSADLGNWDFNLKILDVKEDDEHYYITHTFDTIAVYDYVWKPQTEQKTLRVFKAVLKERNEDLGLYAANQLSQTVNYELSYLKEAQKLQQREGLSKKVVATEYAGLIGKRLNPKEKEFPGYVPVVEPKIALKETGQDKEPVEAAQPLSPSDGQEATEQPKKELTEEERIAKIVNEILKGKGLLAGQQQAQALTPTPTPEPTDDTTPSTSTPATTTPSSTTTPSTTTPATTTPACAPDWECGDWEPEIADEHCGKTITQTRQCTDLNECNTDDGKPETSREKQGEACPEPDPEPEPEPEEDFEEGEEE